MNVRRIKSYSFDTTSSQIQFNFARFAATCFEKTNFSKASSFDEVNPVLGWTKPERRERETETERVGNKNSRGRIEFVSEVSIIIRSKAFVKITSVYMELNKSTECLNATEAIFCEPGGWAKMVIERKRGTRQETRSKS